MEFTEMRKSKEEREAEKARKQQIRNLWQSAGVTDIRGFNNLIDEMTGTFPVPMIAPRGDFVTEVRCSGSEEFANAVRLLAPAPRWFEIR